MAGPEQAERARERVMVALVVAPARAARPPVRTVGMEALPVQETAQEAAVAWVVAAARIRAPAAAVALAPAAGAEGAARRQRRVAAAPTPAVAVDPWRTTARQVVAATPVLTTARRAPS